MKENTFNKATILVLTIGITIVMLVMVEGFLMALFMAAIFAGMLYPLYSKLKDKFGGKSSRAGMVTLLALVFVILIPLSLLLTIVAEQAFTFTESAGPEIKELMANPDHVLSKLESIPVINKVFPDQEKFAKILDNGVKALGNFVVQGLSALTSGTANFLFSFFMFLFAFYYFLIDGKFYLDRILYVLPLKHDEEEILVSRFTTVTKATLKGILGVGLAQGAAGGISMAILGVPHVLLWSVIMMVSTIIPVVGTAMVWIPASLYLMLTGHMVNGIILLAFSALVIGNLDNFIRPRLVGKTAQMPDVMILFSTLGGLAMFGVIGIVVGPIIASLFMTLWEIYGKAYKPILDPLNAKLIDPEDKKAADLK